MESIGILFTVVFTVASIIAGYKKASIAKIVWVETILTMLIGCLSQATNLLAYGDITILVMIAGLFLVVLVVCYIVNKLCWFIGRIVRWMVDGAYAYYLGSYVRRN